MYQGVFLEGNQYLISETDNVVTLIDYISEEHGGNCSQARVNFSVEDFLFILANKDFVLKINLYK